MGELQIGEGVFQHQAEGAPSFGGLEIGLSAFSVFLRQITLTVDEFEWTAWSSRCVAALIVLIKPSGKISRIADVEVVVFE